MPSDGMFVLASGNGPGHRGWLLAIDLDEDGSHVEELDVILSFGITLVGDHIYRMLSSLGGDEQHSELLVYDRTGVVAYRRLEYVADPHGIAFDGHRFAVPCSEINQIVWIDVDGHITDRWQAPGVGDSWHVNGVHVHDGRLFATAFGMHATNQELSEKLGSTTGVIFEVATQRVVANGLRCPHDPIFMDGGWFVCNSRAGELLLIEEQTGKRLRQLEVGGWPRGVAVDDNYLYVGISAERHADDESGRAELVVVDRHTWTVVRRVALPCRELHSVVLIPRSFRTALRRGSRTNAVRVAAQDNEDLFRLAGNIHPAKHFTPMPALESEQCRAQVTACLPDTATADDTILTDVTIVNKSDSVYLTALPHPIAIATRWERCEGSSRRYVSEERTYLPAPLTPQAPSTTTVRLQCPAEPGRYVVTLSLVQEWVRWFNDVDPAAGVVAEIVLS